MQNNKLKKKVGSFLNCKFKVVSAKTFESKKSFWSIFFTWLKIMLCLSEINLVYKAFSELNFVYCKGLGLYIKKKWIKGRCEQFIHIFVHHCLKVLAFALVDVFLYGC